MKKKKIRLDKVFSKQQLLLLKKYDILHGICIENNISYHFLNRCYKRYVSVQRMSNKKYSKDIFQNAIKIYLIADKKGHIFKLNTRGDDACKTANMCGLSK